jgi:hypothetical protein
MSALSPTRPTFFRSPIEAIPWTTVTKMIGDQHLDELDEAVTRSSSLRRLWDRSGRGERRLRLPPAPGYEVRVKRLHAAARANFGRSSHHQKHCPPAPTRTVWPMRRGDFARLTIRCKRLLVNTILSEQRWPVVPNLRDIFAASRAAERNAINKPPGSARLCVEGAPTPPSHRAADGLCGRDPTTRDKAKCHGIRIAASGFN